MDANELKRKVAKMLDAGIPKSEVFKLFSAGPLKANQLAYFIASHPNQHLCGLHDQKVNRLVTIMFIQALLAALLGFAVGAKIGPTATWVVAIFCAAIPLLFAYGFYKNHAGTYNAYIVLTFIQLPNMFKGFTEAPISSSIGLAIGLGMFAYVWYVRSILFPDFVFITPKKIKGQYVFSS